VAPQGLTVSAKRPTVKADQVIPIISIVTVSVQCLSVAIISSNKIDFNFYTYVHGWFFPNPFTYTIYNIANYYHALVSITMIMVITDRIKQHKLHNYSYHHYFGS